MLMIFHDRATLENSSVCVCGWVGERERDRERQFHFSGEGCLTNAQGCCEQFFVLNKLPRHVSASKCHLQGTIKKTAYNALEHLLDIFHLIKKMFDTTVEIISFLVMKMWLLLEQQVSRAIVRK
jgi:hypothetical protein